MMINAVVGALNWNLMITHSFTKVMCRKVIPSFFDSIGNIYIRKSLIIIFSRHSWKSDETTSVNGTCHTNPVAGYE